MTITPILANICWQEIMDHGKEILEVGMIGLEKVYNSLLMVVEHRTGCEYDMFSNDAHLGFIFNTDDLWQNHLFLYF